MSKSSIHSRYIDHDSIDKQKWDHCILTAPNGLVYAYSWYLDGLARTWDAIIINDYEWVMPLPHRRKLGMDYIFQAPLTPVLGLFGKDIDENLLSVALATIPPNFKLWDLSLNHYNPAEKLPYTVYERPNYVLLLSDGYEKIRGAYNTNTIRNIKKAVTEGISIKKEIDIKDVITLSKQQFKTFTDFDEKYFPELEKIFKTKSTLTLGITYGAYSKDGMLLASAAFIFSHQRAYYWLVGNHPLAKTTRASFLLLDEFIKDHAGKSLLLDFEGSDKESVAKFYKGFGGVNEPYSTIFYNRLPKVVKLFKKDPYK